jgi:hypothetical protein
MMCVSMFIVAEYSYIFMGVYTCTMLFLKKKYHFLHPLFIRRNSFLPALQICTILSFWYHFIINFIHSTYVDDIGDED